MISRFILHPKLSYPIPRSDKSLELKLARKVPKRSKRDLRGLRDTLAPGSTDVRISDTTTVIKEPGVLHLKVRNSDIANFVKKAERNTEYFLNIIYLENHSLSLLIIDHYKPS